MIVWSSNYRRIINHFRKTINNYFNLLLYYNEPINDENINEKEKVNIINNENIVNENNDFSINKFR